MQYDIAVTDGATRVTFKASSAADAYKKAERRLPGFTAVSVHVAPATWLDFGRQCDLEAKLKKLGYR